MGYGVDDQGCKWVRLYSDNRAKGLNKLTGHSTPLQTDYNYTYTKLKANLLMLTCNLTLINRDPKSIIERKRRGTLRKIKFRIISLIKTFELIGFLNYWWMSIRGGQTNFLFKRKRLGKKLWTCTLITHLKFYGNSKISFGSPGIVYKLLHKIFNLIVGFFIDSWWRTNILS